MKKYRMSFTLDRELKKRLKRLSEYYNITQSRLIELILDVVTTEINKDQIANSEKSLESYIKESFRLMEQPLNNKPMNEEEREDLRKTIDNFFEGSEPWEC